VGAIHVPGPAGGRLRPGRGEDAQPNQIGTEHILLGLINEGEGVAARALEAMSISFDSARQRVEEIIGRGQAAPTGHIPFTPRAKKVLGLSLREALRLGHDYVGTEHILLGLVREGGGVGAQVVQELGASLQQVRTTVIQLLAGYTASAQEAADGDTFRTTTEFSSEAPPQGRLTRDPRCPLCSAMLAETLSVKELEVEVGDEQRKVRIRRTASRRLAEELERRLYGIDADARDSEPISDAAGLGGAVRGPADGSAPGYSRRPFRWSPAVSAGHRPNGIPGTQTRLPVTASSARDCRTRRSGPGPLA
jgi:hypothetical protein